MELVTHSPCHPQAEKYILLFLYVLQMTEQGLMELRSFDTADGIYDCAWSEENENILISASGDGSIKAWDINAPPQANPLRSLEEHTHEVYSLHWNLVRRDCFLSASWDDTIKLWNMASPHSLRTFTGHTYCVYAAQWCVAVNFVGVLLILLSFL